MPAPIIVFAYKRPTHLERTLTALSRNELASKSDLFIFCDAAKAEKDVAVVEQARAVARQVKGFKRVKLTLRETNMGLARSVIAGVSEIIAEYGRVVVVEDDIQTSKKFLTYINKALDFYADDPSAFSVTGFSYPAEHLPIPKDYAYDTYASYRAGSWTWATWADRWKKVQWDMDYFPAFTQDLSGRTLFNRGGADLFRMLRDQFNGRIDSWAIRFAYAQHALNMSTIYPTRTLAKNIGLDGSGVHTGEDPKAEHGVLSDNWLPKKFCPAGLHDARIDRSFYEIFGHPYDQHLFRRLLARLQA